ncbi:MAG TPA: hypothetical protein VJU79_09970, partial [Candidatus Dormibacteraeota bacterium]|nr:hypothetical protein [Candidatus Dormibacteraeota bacterium]
MIDPSSPSEHEGMPPQAAELEAELARIAAQLDEAQTRAATLEQVVGVETSRKEKLERTLVEAIADVASATAARRDAESAAHRLGQELEATHAEREQAERRAAMLAGQLGSAREQLERRDAPAVGNAPDVAQMRDDLRRAHERAAALTRSLRQVEQHLEAEARATDQVRA